MTDAGSLLDLQAVDTELDQARRRRERLEDRARLADATARLRQLTAERDETAARRGALASDQRRLEDEVSSLVDRIRREERRESTLTTPRELQAVEAELASLRTRRDEREERILELMEEIEPIDTDLGARAEAIEELRRGVDALTASLAAAEAEIDALVVDAERRRDEAAERVPADLRSRYESLRSSRGGVVVGHLDGDRCTACMLQIPPMEVERLRDLPAGSVDTCDCGAMLVVG